MADRELRAADVNAMVTALGLVPVPDHLMAQVLKQARAHRANVRRFEEAGIDVQDVVTAQPYRV